MADDVTPMQLVPEPRLPAPSSEGWGNAPTLMPPRSPLERPLNAVKRYKWLVVGIALVAAIGGAIATRFVKPEYEVKASIWIASLTPQQDAAGPIRQRELLNAFAWVELAKSFKISDAVVRQMSLYLKAAKPADEPLLRDFHLGDRIYPGTFTIHIDKRRNRWRIQNEEAQVSDSGVVGDSIGRPLGLKWQPDSALLARFAGRDIQFTVANPRDVSVELMKRLTPALLPRSNFLWLTLTDADGKLGAKTLNAFVAEYVKVAGDLKKANVVQLASILEGQVQTAEQSLREAETSLEQFRIQTITMPAEGGPVAAGVDDSKQQVFRSYFDKKIEFDNLKHDVASIERSLAGAAAGTLPYESLLLIPSVGGISPGGGELRQSFMELTKAEADLAAARQIYTDKYPVVVELTNTVETLKKKTIPAQANVLLSLLKERQIDYEKRIAVASIDLQGIPVRTIEEMRLRRSVQVAEVLYSTLKQRYSEAKLAEAGSTPDVSPLDPAMAPESPSKNTAPRMLAVAILGGVAAGIGLALLLDNLDKRLRYPEQAAKELGLSISGTVPELPRGGLEDQSPEQISQLIESFRTLRMNVMNSGGAQVSVAVSSPSPGDGKSFIASNLAMSFADAGYRTLLVDGDTRRGALHEMFGLSRTAGLTDFLAGDVDERAIVHATGHDNLSLIPTGTLRRRSPELLTSPALARLVRELRNRYDVVIFDTPPLAAGIDGYAIAAATGNLLVVLRIGQTERRMAAAKLLLVDRLPINVLGSVLNGAPSEGEYVYYGYVSGYGTEGLEPAQQVAQISS